MLITEEYGCALCIGTVLTNAPLPIENRQRVMPKCGSCTVCKDICPANVIHGTTWEPGMNRDLIVDVYHCECCLKCLVQCPRMQHYMESNI
ncbi:hypothetical protein [Clostridium sp. HMP27]|uniref:hypothetical protein n=1 Tax=Clostridium sp. HMP27 TaxID=1487921 RepID=UPI0025C2D3BA|nr:hypothetical protein [Clostridium sp. HMP27]